MAKRGSKIDRSLTRLRALREGDAAPDELRAAVHEGLAQKSGLVVAEAAQLARMHELVELRPALHAAFARLLDDPIKRDPGCGGKLAVLDALDHLDEREPDIFLRGLRLVQMEPVWGSREDSAGGVRTRSGAALARMHHDDTLLALAALAADPISDVRRAAFDTLAFHGVRAGAALALHKIRLGDEDPVVETAAMAAALKLAPAWTVEELRSRLLGGSEDEQELVGVALGQSDGAEALALLVEWFEQAVLGEDRVRALSAMALHRSDEARAMLLRQVAEGSPVVARGAIRALSLHRYDARLREKVIEAATRSAVDGLAREARVAMADD